MRIVALVLLAALAGGCGDRRSFDERFSDSENAIEQRAERIDRDLANEAGESEPGDPRESEKR